MFVHVAVTNYLACGKRAKEKTNRKKGKGMEAGGRSAVGKMASRKNQKIRKDAQMAR